MRKRLFSVVLVVSIIMSMFVTMPVHAATYTDANGNIYYYTIIVSSKKVRITGFTGSGEVIIPSKIDGYPVMHIYEKAFYNDAITSVVIPEGVVSIGEKAFYCCSSLVSITIPSSIQTIEENAFAGCSLLTETYISDIVAWCNIDFETTTSNPVYASNGGIYINGELIENLVLPDDVTSIGDCAFSGYSSLKNITIPNSVTSIGSCAFYNCDNLINIDIPESVTYIGGAAFYRCSKLINVNIPSGVREILSQTFSGCTSLRSILIPDMVKIIEYAAFSASGITSIIIPYGVTTIETSAFHGCKNLTSIEIPNGITVIESDTFYGCSNLTSIYIPNTLTKVEQRAFCDCSNLKDVYYGGSEDEWEEIDIVDKWNYNLKYATKHYNGYYGNYDKTLFAEITYNGTTYDLLSQPVNIQKDSDVEVSVKVNYEDWTGNEKIYITQNAENSIELVNNAAKDIKPGQVFNEKKDIYILIVDEETGESKSYRTRLRVVDDTANGEWFPDSGVEGLNFKLGKETGFTIPESVPVFGDTEIKWDFDFIPISFEYDKEDNNKMNIVFGANIAHSDGEKDKFFKDFSFKKYKESFKKMHSLKAFRNHFKMTNDCKMNFFGDKVIGGGSGKPSFDFNVAGYAESKIIDGHPTFLEGQLRLEAEVSYTHKGQLFIWVVPLYYEIGGGGGAGFEGNMIDLDSKTFTPEFEAYLTAKVKANLGTGLGVPKIATLGAAGKASLNLKTALHKDYLKSWGEGEANFNVKVFGKEVAKKVFAKGDFLIFETGNSNGLIKDGAVTALAVNDNIYESINVNSVYENESRDYAASPTEWYGDIPPIMLMSAEYTNKNLQLLAENVYTETAPMICDIDGKKVMVMLWDGSGRDDVNRSMVAYSVYNEVTATWTQPVAVCDDGTADFYPCFKDGYLVWQNSSIALDDNMTLTDIAKLGEICISKWNGESFDEPVVLTENEIMDTLPNVCADGDKISVIWITNTENDILGISGTNSIMQSDFDGSTCSEAKTVKSDLNAITNMSAGYIDGVLNIAYVVDEDNDLQTINDRDISIIANSVETKLTDNEVLDSNPVFSGDVVYYYSDGNIAYSSCDGSKAGTVFEEAKSGLTDTFTVDTNANGDVAIWWAKALDGSTEVFCTLNRDGEWSDEIQISEAGNQSRYPTGVLEENGAMYVAFNNATWQDGEITKTDLYTLEVTPSYDLSVFDAYIDEDTMMVYATVKNTGELAVNSYTLTITDTDANNEITVSEALKAGESAEVKIQYIKPDDLDKRSIVLSVSSENEEYNLDNNSSTLTVGNCDVEVTKIDSYEILPLTYASATITNTGYSDSGTISVCLRKEKADGTVLSTKSIDNLAAGESTQLTFSYDAIGNENIQWYITTETENDEISLGNNDQYFINNYANTVSDYGHEILRYSVTDSILNVNAFSENNTTEDLTAVSAVAVYGVDGKLKSFAFEDITVPEYESVSVDFSIANYTYAKGDYMKLFLWDSLNDMISVLEDKEIPITFS